MNASLLSVLRMVAREALLPAELGRTLEPCSDKCGVESVTGVHGEREAKPQMPRGSLNRHSIAIRPGELVGLTYEVSENFTTDPRPEPLSLYRIVLTI